MQSTITLASNQPALQFTYHFSAPNHRKVGENYDLLAGYFLLHRRTGFVFLFHPRSEQNN
jgi:hypothetical protein